MKNMTAKDFWSILTQVGYEEKDYARVLNAICTQMTRDADVFDSFNFKVSAEKLREKSYLIYTELKARGYYDDVM